MLQQIDLFSYKLRFLFAGIFTVTFLVGVSAIVTAVGSNSVLAKGAPHTDTTYVSESPNAVTDAAYNFANGAKHATYAAGTAIYRACRSVTVASTQSGRFIARTSASAIRGVGSGILFNIRLTGAALAFTGHALGGGFAFIGHTFGNIFGFVSNVSSMRSVVQPANDSPVPVINSGLSPALLAHATAQAQQAQASQQQSATALRAAQLAANRSLDGSVVAGDPSHGGYPARWDNIAQDSSLDSWGMYNRECVSYAAWKVYQTYGYMPYWGGVGNANQWPSDARAMGIPTSTTPRVHSVAISMHGYYGHAMWVEAVRGDMVYVSQYNYDLAGHYSEMWVNGSNFTYIYFK